MNGPFGVKQDLNPKKMIARIVGAARLSGKTFNELRDDPTTTIQSISLVPAIGLCYGGGLGLFGYLVAGFSLAETLLITLVGVLAAGVIGFLWSGITFMIVTKLFHRTIGYWGLARPLFFAWAPGLLFIFLSSPDPAVSELFRIVTSAWVAIASIFAVKHAVGFSVQQGMMTFIIAILILVLALLVFESVANLLFT